jgi:hypothetical protein
MALRHLVAVDRVSLSSLNCIRPSPKFDIILDWHKAELNFLRSISYRLLRAGLIENRDLYGLEINDIHRHTCHIIRVFYEPCVQVMVKHFLYTP